MTKKKNNLFIVMWDQLGLEGIVDANKVNDEEINGEHHRTFTILKDGFDPGNAAKGKLSSILDKMKLRAKFNSHRHYEIYSIKTDKSMKEAHLRQLFESDPQAAADLIRQHGAQQYSDRENPNRKVIS